jgi:hypothetical protein
LAFHDRRLAAKRKIGDWRSSADDDPNRLEPSNDSLKNIPYHGVPLGGLRDFEAVENEQGRRGGAHPCREFVGQRVRARVDADGTRRSQWAAADS